MTRILAVFAHPDDEGAVAGTLARYAEQGAEVMLVCATRGEAGEISDPELASPDTLGAVREAELHAAGRVLGIGDVRFLGYRDSGMRDTPANQDPRALIQADPAEAAGRLVALIREQKPDVVITFEPFGWYGHPDHQAVSDLVTAAYDLAPEATAYPETGAPWQPQRLYYAVLPASMFQTMTDYAREHGFMDGDGFEIQDAQREAEAQITHTLNIEDLFETKMAAMDAHRTQFGVDNWFRKFPPDLIRQLWGREYFILARPAQADEPRGRQATELLG